MSISLSPKLLERRSRRESRSRPWRVNTKPGCLFKPPIFSDCPSLLNGLSRSVSPIPVFRLRKLEVLRSEILGSKRPTEPFKFRQLENFPFLRLPYDIQVIIGEFVVSYKTRFKAEDFISHKDGTLDLTEQTLPLKELTKEGYPAFIPLLQVCPVLLRDVSRTFYKVNTFFIKTVPHFNAFFVRITEDNIHRLRHLQLDNEFIYCNGVEVGHDDLWRSYVMIDWLKSLETVTLYRDDGGPNHYTEGGHDEFNSVEWFTLLAAKLKTLKQIRFALHPWTGFDPYELKKSNMVAWIKDWEHEWDAHLVPRRKGKKMPPSWYLAPPPPPAP